MMNQRKVRATEIESAPFRRPSSIVAIPARDEADRIEKCLSALAIQRDYMGAPLEAGTFSVLLLANNCTDNTAAVANGMRSSLPYPLEVLEVQLLVSRATAGGARRRAMGEAAARLQKDDDFLLTTDADSLVAPTWLATNTQHLTNGADCVAGFIDAEPHEIVTHGSAFLSRGRLEDTYLRLVAEIYARCDPRPHDPWPNHQVSSGASLAVTRAAYRAVGGMPPRALGEDSAFTALLDRKGFKVRHALDVTVATSCRLDGRATGGAADTMRYRRDVPDAVCDDDIEPAFATLRRALMRGLLRKAWHDDKTEQALRRMLGNARGGINLQGAFEEIWNRVETQHPKLQRGQAMRPSDLPPQIAVAHIILRNLRPKEQKIAVPSGRSTHARAHASIDA